ncbi:hypothetical protein K3495_g2674 [Podosphaera aphanis]|nr:hypothetical protein K3495_g2674 [Podosphaera aphanis]
MVSLWPWRAENNSPASFEKTLSALATKISSSQAHLESLRSNQRRYRALWTLYTSFIYILGLAILVLVIGWKNWSIGEGSALAGFPVFVVVVRTAITSYYTYRIDSATQRLEKQLEERHRTIEKLKTATKYNSTLELLEKYGATKPKPKRSTSSKPAKTPTKQPQRTSSGPPPTANIPRQDQSTHQRLNHQPSLHNIPQEIGVLPAIPAFRNPQNPAPGMPDPPEFAPNAFTGTSQYAQSKELLAEGHWYDRVLDLLLGEDETLPKNRLALICENCRLVNGQAPPGTRSLYDLGKWRCFGCGSLNGEDETVKTIYGSKDLPTNSQTDLGQEIMKTNDDKLTTETGQQALEIGSEEETTEEDKGRPKVSSDVSR